MLFLLTDSIGVNRYTSEPVDKVFDVDKTLLQDPSEVLVGGLPQDCFVSAPFSYDGTEFRTVGLEELKLRKLPQKG